MNKLSCKITQHKKERFIITFLLCAFFILIFHGCGQAAIADTINIADTKSMKPYLHEMTLTTSPSLTSTLTPSPTPTPSPTLTPSPTPTPTPTPEVHTVSLVSVGDDLIHQKVVNSGLQEDGTYNYDHLFSVLKEDFESADIAVINQETILGTNDMEYTGYPRFCSPKALGDSIRKAGFDVVLHATNHIMDRKIPGIESTLDYWKGYPEITVLGIHDSMESYGTITVVERNDIKIAMLNYTYGMNGFTLPNNKFYLVNGFNLDNMKQDIRKAREIADFIIVFPHWGNEYVYKPSSRQKEVAQMYADEGVDLVIGAHPHVLQPVTWITGKDGNQMLCYYSLGNYVSSMDYTDRVLGGMAQITIKKDDCGCYIEDADLIPIVTHYERGEKNNFGVFKLQDYTEEQAKKHYILRNYRGADFSIDRMEELVKQIIGDNWKNGN